MRELFFILIVILLLLALTAIRYRKQIAGMIGLARMLKEAKAAAGDPRSMKGEQASVHLVSCSKCGVWIPQSKAIKLGTDFFYCSETCKKLVTNN